MQVYVVNLARSPERRAHITAELAKTGLDYEIVTAVDGRDLDLDDVTLITPALLARNAFPAGAAGCALSHLRVYEEVLARGLDHALIIEDDVTLPADLGPSPTPSRRFSRVRKSRSSTTAPRTRAR